MRARDDHLEHLKANLEASPFWRHMGIKLRELSEGAARLEMPISPELMNSNGTLHGGAVASLLDAVIGVTIRSKWSTRISTVYLTTHYVNPVREGVLYATAQIADVTRKRIVPVEARAFDAEGRVIAVALGAYAVREEPDAR